MMGKFFGKEVQVEEQNIQLVGINEIVKTDEHKSILATRDIKSCIAILLICEKEAYMLHIETLDDNNYKLGLKNLEEMLNNVNSKVIDILMFYGKNKSNTKLEDLGKTLNTNHIYQAYMDNDNGSIAYDFKTAQLYGVDDDGIFYEYKQGDDNQKIDPLVASRNDDNHFTRS